MTSVNWTNRCPNLRNSIAPSNGTLSRQIMEFQEVRDEDRQIDRDKRDKKNIENAQEQQRVAL